jgi:magnesium transporter
MLPRPLFAQKQTYFCVHDNTIHYSKMRAEYLIYCSFMITHYYKAKHDDPLKTITSATSNSWTHVVQPSESEFQFLIDTYNLDETIIKDIGDFFEVPRFEQDQSISYFFTRYPYDLEDIDIDTAPILIILGETFLITVSQQEVPFLDAFIQGKRACVTEHKTELFIEFLRALITAHDQKLTQIRKMVYRDMERIRSIRGREIQRFVFLEQQLNETISALVPTNEWIQQLTKGNHIQFFVDDKEALEDLLIANTQLINSAQSILKTIQNIRGASEAILTQNLNNTIRTLTAVTIILTIPTLISSLFGMNVPIPLQESPYSFWIIVVGILAILGLTIYLFSKNRWL